MNASYKIVLLAAFALFAAIVGYYVITGGDDTEQKPDDNANKPLADNTGSADNQQDDDDDITPPARRTTPDRQGLDRDLESDPDDNQVTIGTGDDDPIDDILIRPGQDPADTDPIDRVSEGPDPDDLLIRPGPGVGGTETPATDPLDNDPDRPGPGIDPGTTDPGTDPGTETPDPRFDPDRNTTPPSTTKRTYTIEAGDTFTSIALKVYGKESAWFEIAQANPSVDPKRLQVGQEIVLPNLANIEREREQPKPPAPGADQTYTVRPGDTLSGIAEKFYNDSQAWDLIYNRNRDKIGDSPNALKAGMELIIPQPYSGAE